MHIKAAEESLHQIYFWPFLCFHKYRALSHTFYVGDLLFSSVEYVEILHKSHSSSEAPKTNAGKLTLNEHIVSKFVYHYIFIATVYFISTYYTISIYYFIFSKSIGKPICDMNRKPDCSLKLGDLHSSQHHSVLCKVSLITVYIFNFI